MTIVQYHRLTACLIDAVFAGNTDDHDEAATGWIKKYQENNVEGMKEMINFILKVLFPCSVESKSIIAYCWLVLRL
jgi:hypothetical protein